MSPRAYTEDQLVEQPAIGLFAALGWQTVSAMDEITDIKPGCSRDLLLLRLLSSQVNVGAH